MNPIDEAAAALELAKMIEARASEGRRAAEEQLIALLPVKDEGSVTMKGASYKVSITYGFNRTIDAAALSAIKTSMPPALFEQAIDYKPAINLKGLRHLQSNEPDAYAALAQAITARPAKPSVKIESIQSMEKAA